MKFKWFVIIGIILAIAVGGFFIFKKKSGAKTLTREVTVFRGDIAQSVLSTAVVQPQNRLEMKPPVGGRIDSILVKEGDEVKAGDTVAFMSSTERAALLDAAKTKGEEEVNYWKEIYKPIPLIAPIDGQVIVSIMQPGQTITQADPVIVLSDRLIVQAQIDETDIGRIKEGLEAVVTLDAYPDIQAPATVGHIYHESKIVNNVTIYQVNIIPQDLPPTFRSGMSANVQIIRKKKSDVLLIPLEAVKREKRQTSVLVRNAQRKIVPIPVELGLTDEMNAEVLSGVDENDILIIETKKPSKAARSNSPFMPNRKRPNP